jgi:hypothetical protein
MAQITLPEDILHGIVDKLAREPDIEFINSIPVNRAFCALRNLALVSTTLRDITQPRLFHTIFLCTAATSGSRSCASQQVDERISVLQYNPRLLDHTRRLCLSYIWGVVSPSTHDHNVRDCQRLLAYLLPRLRRLEVFMTEIWYFSASSKWDECWDEQTRKAISSCLTRSPLKTVEVRGWLGNLCFLSLLPASVTTLRVDQGGFKMSPADTTFKPKPKYFQTTVTPRISNLVSQHGLKLFRALSTLDLTVVHRRSLQLVAAQSMKTVLTFGPQTLTCLRLRYHFHNAQGRYCSQPCNTPADNLIVSLTREEVGRAS